MEVLPSYKAHKDRYPLLPSQQDFIEQSRQTVRAILNGTDPRLLLILGPCSIHDSISAKEYAYQLRSFAETVSSHFFIVMRVYCEKPRSASGWKGYLYDPFLDGSYAMSTGIEWTRKLLLELASMGIPAAAEFLDPLTAFYYDDLITWGSIGARTSSSQPHRQLASGLEMPIGFKNGLAGNISAAVSGALVASQAHAYMGLSPDGFPIVMRTNGNLDVHTVLRGGDSGPNYLPSFVAETITRLEHAKLPSRLLIDCSHQNSGKKYERQPSVFQSIMHQIVEGNSSIKGVMLESHLYSGKQALGKDPSNLQYGISITDGCLDWHATSHLIQWGAQLVQQQWLQVPVTHNLSLAEAHI